MKTLRAALKTLGDMAEKEPSLVSDPAWQRACEGIGALVKRDDVRRIIISYQNAPAKRFKQTAAAKRWRTFQHV